MNRNTIFEGKTFESIQEFTDAFKLYCRDSNTNFITSKSEKFGNENAQGTSRPYKMKYFTCAQHRDCTASLRLCLKRAGQQKNKYMITRFRPEHALKRTHKKVIEQCQSKNNSSDSTPKQNETNGEACSSQILYNKENVIISPKITESVFSQNQSKIMECMASDITPQNLLPYIRLYNENNMAILYFPDSRFAIHFRTN